MLLGFPQAKSTFLKNFLSRRSVNLFQDEARLTTFSEKFSTGGSLSRVPLSQCPAHMNFLFFGQFSKNIRQRPGSS